MSSTTLTNEVISLQSASRIILAYGGLALVTFGTIGNVLNMMVFLRVKALRQMPGSIFLFAFFIASLLQLWTTRFSRAIINLIGVDLLALSPFYCQVRWLFGRVSANVTMASICLSSIDRYLVSSRNAHYRHLLTIRRASLIMGTLSFIFSIPFIPDIYYYLGPLCSAPGTPIEYRQFITYFNTVVTSTIPFCILILFSFLTWHNLQSIQNVRSSRLESQVNRMMFAEVGMACFTSLPNIVSNIYTLSTQTMKKSSLRAAQDNVWFNIFTTINTLTYVLSFYLFLAVSSNFRHNVKMILFCQKQNRIGTEGIRTATRTM